MAERNEQSDAGADTSTGHASGDAGSRKRIGYLLPKELTDAYTQDLRLQLAGLSCLMPLAAVGSTKALQEIVAQAHKLRGTADLYGFPAIGSAMADIEDMLTTSALHELQWDKVDQALSIAKAAADGDRT